MDFDKVKEHVLANIISIGIIIGVLTFVKVDVKRDIYFNGTTRSSYRLHFF
jgi:hypothetical protein